MPSIEKNVNVKVDTHITATEARFLDIKDVLIIDNEAFFVLDAHFNSDGSVHVTLDGHESITFPRHESVLIVRVSITSMNFR